MAKSIPALITPEVLQWARELDRISVAEIAPKLKVTEEKILAWESGKEYPTLLQAKDLAKRYRVPFVYFYLPSIPLRAKRIDKVDYRTFPHTGDELLMSRELRWLLRDIEERRDTMIELYTLEDLKPVKQELYIEQETTEQEFAEAIRNLLALTSDRQIGFRRPENALTYCINQLEKKDYLVFQASGIDPQEMRGLSVAYDVFPIIVLNRKDEQSARLFTLCHELVHILSRTSGICNKTGEDETAAKSLELFCNRVAGLVLVPTEELISNPHTSNIKNFGLNDTEVYALSRDFAVSKEVIIHRLWKSGIITERLYYDTLRKYSDEYLAYKKTKKDNSGFLPPALDKGTQVGKLYARTVISAFNAEKISSRDASGFLLNLHVKHFSKVERWCY